MSWDAPPPGEPEPQQPTRQQPTQPYGQPVPPSEPTQPYFPTQPYGQPAPAEQPTAPIPGYPGAYGQPGPYDQPPPQWSQPQPGQYGQPGQYDPYFPPYPIYPTPPPPKRSRTGFYVALGAVAVVVAVGVAVGVAASSSNSGSGSPSALGSSSSASTSANTTPTDTTSTGAASPTAGSDVSQGPHNVVTPTSAGPLHLLSNADTARRIANIASSLAGNTAYGNPKIGFYTVGSNGFYSVWMLAESSTDVPAFQTSVNILGTSGMARQIAKGANMTDVTTESPGPLGGALLCGKLSINGGKYRVCEWVDESSYGWIYFMPSVNNSDVLTYTLDLRGAAEQ